MAQITASELAERLQGDEPPALLDVRQPEEFALASLPDARLIPLGELPGRLTELEDWREREIVVLCHHGVRSLQAIGYLRAAGFPRLVNLAGGIDAWSLEVDSGVARY